MGEIYVGREKKASRKVAVQPSMSPGVREIRSARRGESEDNCHSHDREGEEKRLAEGAARKALRQKELKKIGEKHRGNPQELSNLAG